ncbi:DNA-3-methyladenine glycosylase family protein [Aquihabitans sp. McL0605]|uniref:DNA-3-methyladenine glycosylase family protein n=1 Tax=Aquihabitans sp. McL0605 TaxID=3415671 RepID=UPI003CE6FCFD
MSERTVPLPFPIDLPRTFFGIRRGRHDPTCRIDGTGIWRASRSPAGPVTLHLVAHDDRVEAEAWGPGAEAALDAVPSLIGCHDDSSDFHPEHPLVERLWRDLSGVRVPRSGAVTETLVNVVLEQRVTTFEARRAQSQIVTRWSEPAPGPTELLLPIDPEVLANIAYYDLHVVGVERKRADTVRRVAASTRRLEALVALPPAEAHQRLVQIQGVGPWSAAEVALVALGDADAVPIGDVHLPAGVTFALLGEAIDDDDVMLEALEPFAGHRGRVVRLIGAAGIAAPRHGPRYAPRDIRDQ